MSLRERLRAETRLCHDRVDERFGSYDVRSRAGYAGFLRAHSAALQELRCGIDPGDGRALAAETREMLADLCRDLTALGWPVPVAAPRTRRVPFRSDAVRYVLFGSQIGLVHLRRRWAGTAAIRGADAFLSRKVDGRRWNALRHRLDACAGQGGWADEIVSDARDLFALYARQAVAHPPKELERSA